MFRTCKGFVNISVVKFPMKMKKCIQWKVSKFAQILGILNNTMKPASVQKCSRITFLYLEAKFGPVEKRGGKKISDSNQDESLQKNSRCTLFDRKRVEEILEESEIEPVVEKLGRCKSNWLRNVTRMNNNRVPELCWIVDRMDGDDLENLWRDLMRPKEVYWGLTGDGWWRRWWWWWWSFEVLIAP